MNLHGQSYQLATDLPHAVMNEIFLANRPDVQASGGRQSADPGNPKKSLRNR